MAWAAGSVDAWIRHAVSAVPESYGPGGVPPMDGSSSITDEDGKQLDSLVAGFGFGDFLPTDQRPFASAPVRSRPRRTYDPRAPGTGSRRREHSHVYFYGVLRREEIVEGLEGGAGKLWARRRAVRRDYPSGHWENWEANRSRCTYGSTGRRTKGTDPEPDRRRLRRQPGAADPDGIVPRQPATAPCSCCNNRRCICTPSAQAALGKPVL